MLSALCAQTPRSAAGLHACGSVADRRMCFWLAPGNKPLVEDSSEIDPSQYPGADLADVSAAASTAYVRAPSPLPSDRNRLHPGACRAML